MWHAICEIASEDIAVCEYRLCGTVELPVGVHACDLSIAFDLPLRLTIYVLAMSALLGLVPISDIHVTVVEVVSTLTLS